MAQDRGMNRAGLEAELATKSAGGSHAYAPAAYESPIEERLAWSIAKILPPGSALVAQMPVPTAIGVFRPDLLLYTPGKITALECDGEEFHQDELADDARDAALLESGLIDQIIRFKGVLLNVVPNDAAYIVDGTGAVLFNERMRPVVKQRWNEAEKIHGISLGAVWNAGTLGHHWPELRPLLCDPERRIFVYNLGFDFPLVRATLNRSLGKPAEQQLVDNRHAWHCAMHAYAEYAQVPGRYEGQWAWHKLQDAAAQMGVTVEGPAHSALSDALTTQRLLAAMRDQPQLI
jgi:DNA polymerase-3 subunit epsilon